MPWLLLTTVLACVAIEMLDAWHGKPSGAGLGQDAGRLTWGLARALLKGCLAASAEIAIFRFVLLGEREDRPVWRPPARYGRTIAYGLGLGCTLALLIELLPYLRGERSPWLVMPVALGFAMVAVAMFKRSIALIRGIVAEAAGQMPDQLWPEIRTHWWRLIQVLIWQLALGAAIALAVELAGVTLRGIGFPEIRQLADHATPVIQGVTGPYAFAASFCVMFRSLGGRPHREAIA